MNKVDTQKKQDKNLNLNRETLKSLNDDTLNSIAGGCYRMPFTCTCAF